MTFVVKINGADWSDEYDEGSLRIQDSLNRRNIASLDLVDTTGTLSLDISDMIEIEFDGTLEFSGTIDEYQLISPSFDETVRRFRLRCVDHNAIADRILVAASYSSIAADDIVRDFIDNPLIGGKSLGDFGVTEGTLTAAPTVQEARWSYQYVSEALDELAEFLGFSWYIDYVKKLHFFNRKTFTAGWDITDSSKTYRDTTIRKTVRNYRNRQYLRGGLEVSDVTRTETFVGDGERRTFTLQFPVSDAAPTIQVNGSGKTVGVRGVEAEDGTFQWFYAVESNQISQDSSETVLTSGDTLSVEYAPLFRIVMRGDNTDEQTARGEFEAVEEDDRIKDSQHAFDRVEGLLKRLSLIPEELNIETDNTPRIRSGQLQTITNTALGIDEDEYLVVDAQHVDIGGLRLRTRYKAVDSDAVRDFSDFFRNLITGGRRFSISENELPNRIQKSFHQLEVDHSLIADESNTLSDWEDDPYTVALVGSAVTGKSRVGQVTNP